MTRSLGRIVLILGALLLPLWIWGASSGITSLTSLTSGACESVSSGEASMAPADCGEDDESAMTEIDAGDDGGVDLAEVLTPAGAPRVHPAGRSAPARIGRRVFAGPPLVHLEVQKPPPRA